MRKRKQLIMLVERDTDIPRVVHWVVDLVRRGLPGGAVQITISREKRSNDQNSKLWPMLTDIERQVVWHGYKLTREEWKDVLTAGLKSQKVVPGIDGGFVVIGARTSKMRKKEFCDLVELIYAFGAEQGVRWSEPVKTGEEVWRAAA